jgi:hypothetical protein
MDPTIWGPGFWLALHTITLNYPNNPSDIQKEEITNFFLNLGHILPCYNCRNNYYKHLKDIPINASSKLDLVYWLIDIHNDVNRYLNKPILSREEALNKLLYTYRKETQNPQCYITLYLSLVIILLLFAHIIFKSC